MVAKKKAVKKVAKKVTAKKKVLKPGKPKVRHENYCPDMSDAIRRGRMIHEVAERMLKTNPIINMGNIGPEYETIQIRLTDETTQKLREMANANGEILIPEDFINSYFGLKDRVEITGKDNLGTYKPFTQANYTPSKAEQLKTDNVMTQAQEVIYGDREKTYGHPSLNLESIAQMWNVYIHRKAVVELSKNPFAHTEDVELVDTIVPQLTMDDVCQMMVMLKMARLLNDPTHHDSMMDQVGYIGLQERVQK